LHGRESTVIHPPVEITAVSNNIQPSEEYLAIGRLVDDKRFDLAAVARTTLG
jgi:hypothetical protein